MNQAPDRALCSLLQKANHLCSVSPQNVSSMYEAEKNAQEYQHHPYTDGGDADVPAELDTLTIPDEDAFQSLLDTLTPELSQLASTYLLHQVEKLTFCILTKNVSLLWAAPKMT